MREADAVKYKIEAEAKATAEAERAQGSAKAEVTRLQGLAEAEAKEKLAEAYKNYGEAAILDILAKMLPELAEKIAAPLGNIDKITVVDTGNGDGANRVSNYVTQLMATAPNMIKDVSGLDLVDIITNITSKTPAQAKDIAQKNITDSVDKQ